MARYKNPWHVPGSFYGPEYHETSARPKEYRGFFVYKISDRHFDIVKNGVCLTQRAGDKNNGLNEIIDGIISSNDYFSARCREILKKHAAAGL